MRSLEIFFSEFSLEEMSKKRDFFFSFNFFKVRIRFVECENNGITLTSDSNNLTGLIVFNDNFVNLFFLISSLLFYSGHDLNTIVSIHL